MINRFEVTETNKMIENYNLDVRTITLGISLLDCISDDLETLNNNISITNISDDLSNLLDTPNLDLPINNNLTNDTNDNNFEDLISKYL